MCWECSCRFPVPLLAAAAAGGILSLVIGIIAMARLRRDYQAAVFPG